MLVRGFGAILASEIRVSVCQKKDCTDFPWKMSEGASEFLVFKKKGVIAECTREREREREREQLQQQMWRWVDRW
jgi:hypothetical protein